VGVEGEELRAAEAHIARLEEELLRLKDVKHDLESLREEHRQLRRSAQGRVAKILSAPFRALHGRKRAPAAVSDYERWLQHHRVRTSELGALRERASAFVYQPLVSILIPTFQSNENYLHSTIESVMAQIYQHWELVIVDDGSSPGPGIPERFTADSRVRVFVEKEHAGISVALNVGLSHARGDWIALLDHDDLLESDALFRCVELLQDGRAADVIYSDEDKIIDDHFAAPMLKPDWSPEFFLTHDYLGHFVVIRRELMDEFRTEFDGAQDYDLLLRISEQTDRIRHIPRVLYHWRRTAESTAHNIRRKPGALEAGRAAIQQHLDRAGEQARVTVDWETHAYRVRRQVASAEILIVMPGANAKIAAMIRARTSYSAFNIVTEPAAVAHVQSELLLFLDHDLEPSRDDWLGILAEYAHLSDIGAVAPRILAANGVVEGAGLILLPGSKVRSAFAGMPRDFRGANRQLQMVRNYSAVSASCLMTRRQVLEKIAPGFLDFAQNDRICAGIEFCLKLREAGLRVVSVPYTEVRRTSAGAAGAESCSHLAQRWPNVFACDPFYNPNLSREQADFSLGERSNE
jgi:O-antigen biosynthesis protein